MTLDDGRWGRSGTEVDTLIPSSLYWSPFKVQLPFQQASVTAGCTQDPYQVEPSMKYTLLFYFTNDMIQKWHYTTQLNTFVPVLWFVRTGTLFAGPAQTKLILSLSLYLCLYLASRKQHLQLQHNQSWCCCFLFLFAIVFVFESAFAFLFTFLAQDQTYVLITARGQEC